MTSATGLLWHGWGTDYAVFDPTTGQTHVLDLLAAETLRQLAEGPATVDELILRVAGAVDMQPDQALADMVGALIARFDGLGLIHVGEV